MIGLERSRGVRTNRRVSLQTSCLPVMSHGTALRRLWLWRHSTCFARQVSLTENERQKYAKLRFNACFLDNKFSFSFRYNKQLIAQLVGRHEDLFNPENSCLPRATWIFWVEQIFMSPSKLVNKCIVWMVNGSYWFLDYFQAKWKHWEKEALCSAFIFWSRLLCKRIWRIFNDKAFFFPMT